MKTVFSNLSLPSCLLFYLKIRKAEDIESCLAETEGVKLLSQSLCEKYASIHPRLSAFNSSARSVDDNSF